MQTFKRILMWVCVLQVHSARDDLGDWSTLDPILWLGSFDFYALSRALYVSTIHAPLMIHQMFSFHTVLSLQHHQCNSGHLLQLKRNACDRLINGTTIIRRSIPTSCNVLVLSWSSEEKNSIFSIQILLFLHFLKISKSNSRPYRLALTHASQGFSKPGHPFRWKSAKYAIQHNYR